VILTSHDSACVGAISEIVKAVTDTVTGELPQNARHTGVVAAESSQHILYEAVVAEKFPEL
jgi:hypothetical protein